MKLLRIVEAITVVVVLAVAIEYGTAPERIKMPQQSVQFLKDDNGIVALWVCWETAGNIPNPTCSIWAVDPISDQATVLVRNGSGEIQHTRILASK